MADYTDPTEADEIDKLYANYPSVSEIRDMCYDLGIEQNSVLTLDEDDAWAYYRKLKAMMETRQRKSA
ncbi:MAG: hypothetical protein RDV48_19950 [Candidatus Eremiobacteraeota bacterium]|nr:hypothetical protein [Candidatus Eremiobacteraeota bacterium]